MTLDWDAGGDFDVVLDTLEEVTIRRTGCDEVVTLSAWKFAERKIAFEDSGGAVYVVESTWQFPHVEVPFVPRPGDRLVEADASCSTLFSLEPFRGETRLRGLARRIEIVPMMVEWFDQEQAVWDMEESAEAPIGWTLMRTVLPGHASQVSLATDDAVPTKSEERYRITFVDPVEATTNDRFRSHKGDVYRVVAQDVDELLGAGWSYQAVRVS